MIFSLINVSKEHDNNTIDGYWIQDCIVDNLEEAIDRASQTNEANSNRLNIAVVSSVDSTTPMLNYLTNFKKLN